jgi:RNA polymerase-binding transcription factor DksA
MDPYRVLRQQLMARLAQLERRLRTVETDHRRATTPLEPDVEEQVTRRQHDAVLDQLAAEERQQAVAIRAALARIEMGTYGKCRACGEPIAAWRLAALPYTSQCLACATQAEQQVQNAPCIWH